MGWSEWLGIAGLVLGLISTWPKFVGWFNSLRSSYSASAKRAAEKRELRARLAENDPGYLIAYLCVAGAVAGSAFWLVSLLSGIELENHTAILVAFVARMILSLIGGAAIGNMIGLGLVVVWRKEHDANGT